MRGFCGNIRLASQKKFFLPPARHDTAGLSTYLGALLASTSLTLWVGHGGDLLTGLGRLSLRNEDQLFCPPNC